MYSILVRVTKPVFLSPAPFAFPCISQREGSDHVRLGIVWGECECWQAPQDLVGKMSKDISKKDIGMTIHSDIVVLFGCFLVIPFLFVF